MRRLFLLSPAHSGGRRAQLLLRVEATFPLAQRVRKSGAPLGEVFSFLSGLYFRGKLSYANVFGGPDDVRVITPDRGLVSAETVVTCEDLHAFTEVEVDLAEARYTAPLLASAQSLADRCGPGCEAVLLGSIATGKYVDCLLPIFGERLLFSAEFVGRGDMSRGAMLLRAVASHTELPYISVAGALRRGARPPKLPRLPGTAGVPRSPSPKQRPG